MSDNLTSQGPVIEANSATKPLYTLTDLIQNEQKILDTLATDQLSDDIKQSTDI